jgi:predicted NBD/HSP70 family sugar kinase
MWSPLPIPTPQRRASQQAILDYAWKAQAFTASDAMPEVDLTRSTTIEAIDALVACGLLTELPNAREAGQYSKGRPSRRFELNAQAAHVVGVDAGQGHYTIRVADLRGAVKNASSVDVAHATTAEDRRGALIAAIAVALSDATLSWEDIVSIAVGVPAPVNRHGDSPAHAENFWPTMNPDFRSLLNAMVPLVQVENDAALAAIAERAVGAAQGLDNFVALLAGERFGSGVVVDGHLLRGLHGGVGEMYALIHVEGIGEADGLGSIVARWARELARSGDVPAGHPLAQASLDELTSKFVFELARGGDDVALELVRRTGERLARIAGFFGGFYDPERIIVGGAVAAEVQGVIDVAQELLPGELHLPEPELVASALGADVVAVGAVEAALDHARAEVLSLCVARDQ